MGVAECSFVVETLIVGRVEMRLCSGSCVTLRRSHNTMVGDPHNQVQNPSISVRHCISLSVGLLASGNGALSFGRDVCDLLFAQTVLESLGKMSFPGYVLLLLSFCCAAATIWSSLQQPRLQELSQACRMSRMWPSYADFTHIIDSPSGLSRKYRLLLYREGYLEPFTPGVLPHGNPALFLPGNAGSYGQVRSVASSAALQYWAHDYDQQGDPNAVRPKAQWKHLSGSMDWWTVDFNEDLSAFHGLTLAQQAQFVNEVTGSLLAHYQQFTNITSIPLLAHSMGGVVASLALATGKKNPAPSANMLVTLSTPHAYPPVALDRDVDRVYSFLDKASLNDTLLISISGGPLDTQIPSDPAALELLPNWDPTRALSSSTTALPGLWSPVDHLAMMWCDQLRSRVAHGFLQQSGKTSEGDDLPSAQATWLDALKVPREGDLWEARSSPLQGDDAIVEASIDISRWPMNPIEILTNQSPGGGEQQLELLACDNARCFSPKLHHWRMLPPSPREPSAEAKFPDAEANYGEPGNGIWSLVVSDDDVRQQDLKRLEIHRVQPHQNAQLWMQIGTVAFPGRAANSTSNNSGEKLAVLRTRHKLSAMLDSSFVYEAAFKLSTCKPSYSRFAPFLRIASSAAHDEVFLPSVKGDDRITRKINLVGASPWIAAPNAEKTGFTVDLWSDDSPGCHTVLVQAELKKLWLASLGSLALRYRSSFLVIPLLRVALLGSEVLTGTTLSELALCSRPKSNTEPDAHPPQQKRVVA